MPRACREHLYIQFNNKKNFTQGKFCLKIFFQKQNIAANWKKNAQKFEKFYQAFFILAVVIFVVPAESIIHISMFLHQT